MKNISTRLVITLLCMHMTFAYILGLFLDFFPNFMYFVLIIVPVIALLSFGFMQLEVVWRTQPNNALRLKIEQTAKNLWLWILLCISTLLIVGMLYYGNQLTLIETEISQRISFNGNVYQGILAALILCSILYVAVLFWIKKALKYIWD